VEVEGKTTVALPAVGDTCTSALAQLGQGKLCILDGIFFHDESQLPGVLESAATTKPIVGIKEILLAECGKF
jgi:hypothetical protein